MTIGRMILVATLIAIATVFAWTGRYEIAAVPSIAGRVYVLDRWAGTASYCFYEDGEAWEVTHSNCIRIFPANPSANDFLMSGLPPEMPPPPLSNPFATLDALMGKTRSQSPSGAAPEK